MKIRTGFVSNSSSSSFIVAFPRKPKSKEDVLSMMFGKNVDGFVNSSYGEEKISNEIIAKTVFTDITKTKQATATSIKDDFANRYYVYDGKMFHRGSSYFGTDNSIVEELIILNETYERESLKIRNAMRKLLNSHMPPPVKYACKNGTNHTTKKPFTKQEIAAYNAYIKKQETFEATNAEYLTLSKQENNMYVAYRNKSEELSRKLAEIDYNAFKTANENKYIVNLTYSDNDGTLGAIMEHGDIFTNLNHVRISNH